MYNNSEDYLIHYGVKGMKWGVRRAARGHGGPGIYLGGPKKRLAGYKKDLEVLDKGGHLSVGLTKKRQAAYDKRDRAILEKKIAKNEKKIADKENKKTEKALMKQYGKLEDGYIHNKKVNEKDLRRAYNQIDSSLTYDKRSNKKANDYAEKALIEIDKQLSQTGKKPTYNVDRVNDFVDKALKAIEDDYYKK